MMNRVEMNNEMMEQVNGGERIFDFAGTAGCERMDFSTVDFASAERLDVAAAFALEGR